MGLDLHQAAYIFVLNHAKAVLSAAVRASVMGPYQAQNILASQTLQDTIIKRIQREWDTEVEQAGQVVPALDLWVGRHELLYSRIFNS
jgi:urease accessory protein